MDDDDTLHGKFLNLLAMLAGMLLLVPVVLLFVLWFYLTALVEGVRLLVCLPFGKHTAGVQLGGLQKPHFTEIRSDVPTRE